MNRLPLLIVSIVTLLVCEGCCGVVVDLLQLIRAINSIEISIVFIICLFNDLKEIVVITEWHPQLEISAILLLFFPSTKTVLYTYNSRISVNKCIII